MGKNGKKINLLISIASLYHGGAERVVANLCNNLNPDKFSVIVCWRTACGAIGEELMAQGHEVIGLPEIGPAFSPYSRFFVLKQLMQDRHIDIVHTHDTGALADAAQCRLLGSGTRLVHTYHFGNYPNIKKSHLVLEMIFSRIADDLVAVGYEQAKLIQKSLYLSSLSLKTIYNGVGISTASTQEDLVGPYRNTLDNSIIIGSISTLTEQKGITYLLDIAAILKQRNVKCVFLIAGDGPLRQELEEKCRKLNLIGMVHFLGWVANAGNSLLPAVDVFCQPSLWEANSIVLLEAIAAGLPVVTTDVGESRRVVDAGQCGWVVNPYDTTGMADALTELASQPLLRKRMGDYAKNKFMDNYTIDKMIEGYEQVYEALI